MFGSKLFTCIFTAQYPHEAPGLMKYGATIQDLAARGDIMMKTAPVSGHLSSLGDYTLGIVAEVSD